MALPQNFSSWEFTQRIIRIGHNRDVAAYFRDVAGDDRRDTGRAAVKTALLIRDEDSALEVLNKQLYFRLALGGDQRQAIATMPEWWAVRVGATRPQLIVVFQATTQKSWYQLSIPHYVGGRSPRIPSYRKGNHRGEIVLTDNSKLVVNAHSEAEAEKVLRTLVSYVNPKFIKSREPKLVKVKREFKEVQVKPLFADFYSHGQGNSDPDWRSYL